MVKNDPSDGESHKSSWYNCNDGEGIHAVYGVEEEDYDSDDFDDDFFTDENFAEYMWMENIEEFDKAEMQRLEEEAMTKDCIEACSPRDDEQQADEDAIAADQDPSGLNITPDMWMIIQNARSRLPGGDLNPLAPVFVPAYNGDA